MEIHKFVHRPYIDDANVNDSVDSVDSVDTNV